MDINWKIYDMYRKSEDGFVIQIFGGCEASEGENIYKNIFSFNFTEEAGSEFIPYDDLTEEVVLSWAFDRLDKERFEAVTIELYDEMIQELINPAIIEGKPF